MDKDYEVYFKDKRFPCKFGAKCYQKNPVHHEKYKHPPKKQDNLKPSTKKFRAEQKVIITKNASDSEEEDFKAQNQSQSKNSESGTSTENEDQKVNNDVSDSDSETIQDDSDDAEEDTRKEELNVSEENKHSNELGTVDKENNTSAISEKPNDLLIDEEEAKWARFIKDKFLLTMPKDFYQFWGFCQKIKASNPSEALKDVGLNLVGPFDVLAGKFSNVTKSDSEYLIHSRYFRDPPEMNTVLKSDDPAGYHIGYFRDSPEDLPVLLVSNCSKKNGILTLMGGNIFSAVNVFLDDLKKSGNPFKKIAIGKIQSSLLKEVERLNVDLSRKTDEIIAREKKIVTRTFNKIGLVVPYDKKSEQGYRPLAMDNKALGNCLTKLQNAKTKEEKEVCLSALQPVFTYASIAADECDFGTGIELGWDIISHGVESLNATAERFLALNYRLLNRESFAKIAEAHMRNRKQTINPSIL